MTSRMASVSRKRQRWYGPPPSLPPPIRVYVDPPPSLLIPLVIHNPVQPLLCPESKFDINDPRSVAVDNIMALNIRIYDRRNRLYDPMWRALYEIAILLHPGNTSLAHRLWFEYCIRDPKRRIREIQADEKPVDVILWSEDEETVKFPMSYSTSHEPHIREIRVWLLKYLVLKHPAKSLWIFHPA